MVRQSEKVCSEPAGGGASHHAKQPSAILTGFGSQQVTNAWLLVLMDGTKAKVMLEGMSTCEDSGSPSGQLVVFQDMVSLLMRSGRVFEEGDTMEVVKSRSERFKLP